MASLSTPEKLFGRLIMVSMAVLLLFVACLNPSSSAQGKAGVASSGGIVSRIPFVGCKSDGQVGPVDAPKGESKVVPISLSLAKRLAYYKSEEGFGVVAPRGWHCFAVYGSDGYSLYVSSQPINPKGLFSDTWAGFSGPLIQLSGDSGDTSGRFEVARVIARVFPAHRAFAQNVIQEGIEPAGFFQVDSYSEDKLTYRGNEVVEFQTPANKDGLGTESSLRKNDDPISGVEILVGQTPDLVSLAIRLPPNLVDLSQTIIQQVERDVADHKAR